MAQYALPDSDWMEVDVAEGAGDADADHFDELDEGFGAGRGSGSGPDDGATYWVTTDEDTNYLGEYLTDVTDPTVHTGHTYRGRNCKNNANGKQLDVTVGLQWDGTESDYKLYTNIDNAWTTRAETLTEAEAATIGDYTTLQMWSAFREVGGGVGRIGWESAHEFECPDAGGPTPGFNKVVYTSEPPTANAWNQVKQDAGAGFVKVWYDSD